MTYDSQEQLAAFHRDKGLNYPLLQDEGARHVRAYGILNADYKPGDPGYGVPHPGVIVLDASARVVAKFADPGFRDRPSFEVILDHVSNAE